MAFSDSRIADHAFVGRSRQRSARAAAWVEWRFVSIVAAVVLIITAIPYIFAYLTEPADKKFMGIMLDVEDHIQYFAWMHDFSSSFLASDRLTPEPNNPAFFNLLWWTMGKIQSITGLTTIELYTALRILGVISLLSVTYWFFGLVSSSPLQRRVALLWFAFGSGLGVLWIVIKYLFHMNDAPFPLDTNTAEPNAFRIMLAFPHFAIALTLIVAVFGLLLRALARQRLIYAVAAGVVALILGLQHAYDLITIFSVLGLFGLLTLIRDRRFPRFMFICDVIVVGLSAWSALYSLVLVKQNPVWRKVLSQFDDAGVHTPNLLHLPILLGIPFILALAAFRPRMLLSRSDSEMLIAAWFVAHFALVYVPVSYQIHLLLGWQVPISLLAAKASISLFDRLAVPRLASKRSLFLAALIFVASLSNIYLIAWRVSDLHRHQAPYYLTQDQVAALSWLRSNGTSHDVVLGDLEISQFVPSQSDARVFVGHWANTLDFDQKRLMADQVLDRPQLDSDSLNILKTYDVTYVVRDQANVATDAGLDPSPYLKPVFVHGATTIYRVVLP